MYSTKNTINIRPLKIDRPVMILHNIYLRAMQKLFPKFQLLQ